MPNLLWCSIICALLVAMTWYALHLRPRASMVIVVHNTIWFGAMALIGTNLIAYREASASAWLIVICALIAFNLGAFFAIAPSRFETTLAQPPFIERARVGPLTDRPILVLLFLIYCTCVIVYLASIEQRFGLELLITNPGSIRSAGGESYLESVPLLARLGLYLGPFLVALIGFQGAVHNPFPIAVRIALLIFLAGSMMLLLQRTNLFMGVLWLLALYLSRDFIVAKPKPLQDPSATGRTEPKRARGRIIAMLALAGVILLGSFQLVGSALGKNGEQALSTGAVSEPLEESGLTAVYVYYTAGVMAFLQLTDSTNFDEPPERVQGSMRLGDNNAQTWGTSTFSALLKVIPIAEAQDSINPFIDTGVLTNVFTWLETYYRDFRLPGLVIAMIILGFGISAMFVHRFRSVAIYWIQASFLSTILLSTFATRLNNTLFLAGLLFVATLAVQTKLTSRRDFIGGVRESKRPLADRMSE